MQNAKLNETQAGIKIARRNISNLRYTDDATLMEESKEEWKSLLMKMKEQSEKFGLKWHSDKEDHGIWSHHFMANSWGNSGNNGERLYFLGLQNHCRWWLHREIKRCLLLGRKAVTNLDNIFKKQRHYFANKGLSSQSFALSSSHVRMWELDYKESWALKNWCFWTVVLEKTLECPLDYKDIQPVNPQGNQSWILIGRIDAEAEIPILWPPDASNCLIGKVLDAGKDWRQEQKGVTEAEMVGVHHQLDGHEFEQALGAGDGQGNMVYCSPWGWKELEMTEQLNCAEGCVCVCPLKSCSLFPLSILYYSLFSYFLRRSFRQSSLSPYTFYYY